MPLTPEQAKRVAEESIAIRAAPTAANLAGAGYGLYTPGFDARKIREWDVNGPEAGWYDALYNTGLFMLAMPGAETQFVLFVPQGGDPQGEAYSVANLPGGGGRGAQVTLPKVNALAHGAQVAASLSLHGQTPQTISDWVIAQL